MKTGGLETAGLVVTGKRRRWRSETWGCNTIITPSSNVRPRMMSVDDVRLCAVMWKDDSMVQSFDQSLRPQPTADVRRPAAQAHHKCTGAGLSTHAEKSELQRSNSISIDTEMTI